MRTNSEIHSVHYCERSQQWALRRFAGLAPHHIGGSFHILSLAGNAPPPGFEEVWRAVPADAGDTYFAALLSENVTNWEAILLLLHPFKRCELLLLCQLMEMLHDMHGDNAPPLYCICHTIAPELLSGGAGRDCTMSDGLRVAHECGIEDFAGNEACGFRLALEIRMMIAKTRHLADMMFALRAADQHMRNQKARLEALVHEIIWEYLFVKAGDRTIPRVDHNLPAGIPQQLSGWTVGKYLGRGQFGSVYLMTKPSATHRPEGSRRVVKLLAKSQFKDFGELSSLQRSIGIMGKLSSMWQHPGIVKLYRVYHSPSHILLCMQYGGSENLFRRLKRHEKPTSEHCHLSPGKVCAIITQAVAAVAHMHTGPEVSHRDIKPENYIVEEDEGHQGLLLKLTDFDFASPMGIVCRTSRGSLPFMAPEVMLGRPHRGGPADVWSLAVVILEVLCRTRILEQVLQLPISPEGAGDRAAIASDLARHFGGEGSASALVKEHCQPELADFLPTVAPVLEQTLQIAPAHRLLAQTMSDALSGLAAAGSNCEG
mmetsp:Transcript_147299/g.410334  ORF Transcript_147299/g.410334 Transcript_147299/m.410334 type:complete len:542 (-) Transcript_147299:234-1859(-)